jgi:phosphatidylglycerol:prolipoprotein diacylglycerol transferase
VHPIVTEVSIFGTTRPIGGYGLLVAIGVALSAGLAARAANRIRADVGAVIATLGYTTMASFAGAFLLFWIVMAARTGDPWIIREGGGLVFYGAVPGGALAAYWGARALDVPYRKMVDLAVPGIAAGHAIGRIGCFLGGCCFGAEWHGPRAR